MLFKIEGDDIVIDTGHRFSRDGLSTRAIKILITASLMNAVPELRPELERIIESIRVQRVEVEGTPPLSRRVGHRNNHRTSSMVDSQEHKNRHAGKQVG